MKEKIKTLPYQSLYGNERTYSSFAYGEGLDGAFRY